jgi:hypothetical protein
MLAVVKRQCPTLSDDQYLEFRKGLILCSSTEIICMISVPLRTLHHTMAVRTLRTLHHTMAVRTLRTLHHTSTYQHLELC